MSNEQRSLYERLGGYDAIAALVDNVLPRIVGDPELAVYFRGKSKDSLKRDRQLIVDFLCSAFGGPVVYTGRDMKTAHDGLGITEREWKLFEGHVQAALGDRNVAPAEQHDFLAAAAGLKADVVDSSKMVAGV